MIPVVGSSPTASAFQTYLGSLSNSKTPTSHVGSPGATPGGSTQATRSCGLAAKAAPLQGDDRWFESTQDHSTRHRSPTAEAVVSNTTQCEFESHRCYSGRFTKTRNPSRLAGLGSRSTKSCPSRHETTHALAEQPGVLATLSRWRSSVQIRPGVLDATTWRGSPTAEASGLSPECCGFESHPRYMTPARPSGEQKTTCVGWALASPSGCNPPAFELWRFNSVPTHLCERMRDEGGRMNPEEEFTLSRTADSSFILLPSSLQPPAHSSNGQDARFSTWKREFDSPMGH